MFDKWLEVVHEEHVAEAGSVHHLMQESVVACAVGDTVQQALGLMFEHDVGVLPVVDRGRVVGIVTDRDLARAVHRTALAPGQIGVVDAASTPVHVVRQDDPIADAVAKMREHRVHRLPVVDGSAHLVGLISIDDIARGLEGSPAREAAKLTSAYASMAARPR
jgi:CBS domain-containing protein